jgi:hypothetical protein
LFIGGRKLNLQPFYDLRERLAFTAAAGTQLVQEDFRLKEAGKQIEAYAKASPVFAKISQMAKGLYEGPKEARTETLLDLIGLLDAFLITQGRNQAEGDLKDICILNSERDSEERNEENQGVILNYKPIPYSRLHPFLNALISTGSGRQALLSEAYELDPELIFDYRVSPLLVQALGDSYSEIADMVFTWIVRIGSPIVSLLKEGFHPNGKKDMVRRVKAVSAIAGEKENDFYRNHLEESKKEIREALICALHHHQGNRQLLFDLLKTDKGKMKNAVLWSLSFMEGEEVHKFWNSYPFSNGLEMANLLGDSRASYIPGLVAKGIRNEADKLLNPKGAEQGQENSETDQAKEEKEWEEGFFSLLNVCTRRMEGEIRQILEWIAGEPGLKKFRSHLSEVMMETIFSVYHPEDENSRLYKEMAQRLLSQYGDVYFEPVFAAALAEDSASQVYEQFHGIFDEKSRQSARLFHVMQRISYEPEKGYVVYLKERSGFCQEVQREQDFRILKDGIDIRWYSLFMKHRHQCPKKYPAVGTPYTGCDALLYRLRRRNDENLKESYCQYFYSRALREGPSAADVAILKENGWTDFKGFVETACKTFQGSAWVYRVRELIWELPMESEQLTEELEAVKKAWAGKTINGSSVIDRWLEQLHNGASKHEVF